MTTAAIRAPYEIDFPRLCSTLEEMIEAHQKLQTCLQAEKRKVIAGDVEGLALCAQEKEATLAWIHDLEGQRLETLHNLDASDAPPTLKRLIPLCPPRYRERLRANQSRLEALVASIQEINQLNGMLVARVLGQISGLLEALQHLTAASPTYQQNGVVNASPSGGRTFGKR